MYTLHLWYNRVEEEDITVNNDSAITAIQEYFYICICTCQLVLLPLDVYSTLEKNSSTSVDKKGITTISWAICVKVSFNFSFYSPKSNWVVVKLTEWNTC